MHAETVLGVCTEGGVVGEQLRMRQVCQIPLCDLVSNAFISPPPLASRGLSSLRAVKVRSCQMAVGAATNHPKKFLFTSHLPRINIVQYSRGPKFLRSFLFLS